jgi:hypothetical protein
MPRQEIRKTSDITERTLERLEESEPRQLGGELAGACSTSPEVTLRNHRDTVRACDD